MPKSFIGNIRLIFLLFIANIAISYEDEELSRLWMSIPDIGHPTLEDYQAIDAYLENGKRPYLDRLTELSSNMGSLNAICNHRLKLIRGFRLLGPQNALPIFETHFLNPSAKSPEKYPAKYKDRCILLFGSANGIYPEKTRKVFNELQECGYTGHVLMRIGGFPNTENGGLKICHVPYSFKAAFLKEAQALGFKQVLWLDTAIHPLTDLESIFAEIEEKGYFLTYVGTLEENAPHHLLSAAKTLHIHQGLYPYIKHLSSSMIGLNFSMPQANQLLDEWLKETERVYPNITWFPEELSFSVAAWRTKCTPSCWFGDIVCAEDELDQLLCNRLTLECFLDSRR